MNSEALLSPNSKPWLRQLTIGTKVALLLSVTVLLASATVGVITYRQFSQALVDQELKQLSDLAQVKSVRLTAELENLKSDALFIAHSPVIQRLVRSQKSGTDPSSGETEQLLRERAISVFHELLRAKPAYCQVRLISVADVGREVVRVDRDAADGTIRTVPRSELQQKGREPYFASSLNQPDGKVFLTDINLNREHGRVVDPPIPVIRAGTPVLDQDGKPAAIVVINRLFQPLVENLRDGLMESQTLLVANNVGEYLVNPDATKAFAFDHGKSARIQEDFPELSGIVGGPAHPPVSIVDTAPDGRRVAIGICRVPIDRTDSQRYVEVALAAPYEAAVAVSTWTRHRSVLAGIVVAIIALGSGYLLSRSMTEPLREIAAAAEAFGRGEANCRLPTGNHDEIGVVARSVAEMMTCIRSAQADLELRAAQLERSRRAALNMLQDVESSREQAQQAERTARDQALTTQAILDGASDAIVTVNVHGIIESFNMAAERIFGYQAQEVIGRNVNILMPSPYCEEHDGYLHNYLETGIAQIIGIGREVFGLRKDGTQFPMYLSISDVKLGDRRLFTGIMRDITDLKQTMQQLTAANEELARRSLQIQNFNFNLKRSNDELKQFAYVASHDLQEPLRKVTAFCQMLQDEYGERLDDNARTYIQYAVDGALRMKTLVQDLLAYSRVETQGKPLEPTDADAACAEAIDNLAVAIAESSAEVTRDPLPTVRADRAQLVRLFQNLIGNAIKYRGEEPPRVNVSAAESNGDWEFRVSDNGIGIDTQYHQRIFVIFQRLHAREEYSGTGIGLAVCKRIVERAGGRIWVESKLGAGSVFCFTLPKATSVPSQGESSYDRHTQPVLSVAD